GKKERRRGRSLQCPAVPHFSETPAGSLSSPSVLAVVKQIPPRATRAAACRNTLFPSDPPATSATDLHAGSSAAAVPSRPGRLSRPADLSRARGSC
ncbi:MAG: hypothetical protein BJ554DRAFT_4504, partial [Olpidium bornovanus]